MASIKCFLIEKTGEVKKVVGTPCDQPACTSCGKEREIDLWRRTDTGEIAVRDDFPAGAMWFSDSFLSWPEIPQEYCGPDGKSLCVLTPGGVWMVDSVASNCTRKDDTVHKCWIRHGTAPEITVDKEGYTCAAGAGSIKCGNYHGFLRNGYLEGC